MDNKEVVVETEVLDTEQNKKSRQTKRKLYKPKTDQDVVISVRCCGHLHQIAFQPSTKKLILFNHTNEQLQAATALHSFAGSTLRCLEILNAWKNLTPVDPKSNWIPAYVYNDRKLPRELYEARHRNTSIRNKEPIKDELTYWRADNLSDRERCNRRFNTKSLEQRVNRILHTSSFADMIRTDLKIKNIPLSVHTADANHISNNNLQLDRNRFYTTMSPGRWLTTVYQKGLFPHDGVFLQYANMLTDTDGIGVGYNIDYILGIMKNSGRLTKLTPKAYKIKKENNKWLINKLTMSFWE